LQLRQNILRGALYGLWAWLVYGIVEVVLTCAIQLLFERNAEILGWQLRALALVFGVYALLGVTVGAAVGTLFALSGRHRERTLTRAHYEIAASLTLALAFLANLVSVPLLSRSQYIAGSTAVLLIAVFTGGLTSNVRLVQTAFLANPWVASLLLLAGPWIAWEALPGHSNAIRAGAALALTVAIVMSAWFRHCWGAIRIRPLKVRAVMASAILLVFLFAGRFFGIPSPTHAKQSAEVSVSRRCNVVLITMDTVRADHLGVDGYERDTTPNLQNLAREATVYSRAFATSDQTLTTHASIFTGLYPSWHGAYYAPPDFPEGRPLSPNSITLAEVLRSHGYWTAAVVANHGFLDPSFGFSRGFAVYDHPAAVRLFKRGKVFYIREGVRRLLSLVMDTSRFEATTLLAADINHQALNSLDHAGAAAPFFLFLNYMDAHSPYFPPQPFNRLFPGRDARFDMFDLLDLGAAVQTGKRPIRETERSHLISQYDGGIAYIDSQIGDLLTRLRQRGLYENTLIIVTSDHGEAFGDRKLLLGHALGSVYQDVVHVPLLIKYPGQHKAEQSDGLVSQVDLMPTVLDVTGIAMPAGLQGLTLRLPRTQSSRAVYTEAVSSLFNLKRNPAFRGVRRAIIAHSWKLITWTDGPPEVYDLAADPNETRNQYQAGDPRAAALVGQLSAWAATAPHQFEQSRKLDKNAVEHLRSLGYAQ
jgi:arylsulfatase A-like enzyme